jgi:hypothetical protein
MKTRVALLFAGVLLAGCSTKRTLWIESDPPGARVFVDGVDRGPAPAAVPFVHYGDFDVRLEHPGHVPWAGVVSVASRIDGYPVVDLPFELAVRHRAFRWKGSLLPIPARPTEADARAAYDRALEFRARTHREVAEPGTPGRIEK